MRFGRFGVPVALSVSALMLWGGSTYAAAADTYSASISGHVLDNAGAPVRGATIQAITARGGVHSTTSDARGRFAVNGLAAGTYALKFSDHVGLYSCPEGPCAPGEDRFRTEWLGDAPTMGKSETITLTSGEKHTGVRELFDHDARISGEVTLDGHLATINDGVIISTYRDGRKTGGLLGAGRWFADIQRVGNYRFRVTSYTHQFKPFWIVDPRDGNTTFHSDRIEKITGVSVDATTGAQ